MKHKIIGTAGHVDHGKTTLIQALTGTNTDRLKEEIERGMTIDLGFASLTLPDGTVVGIVDVPGHERFLKNMLAGISGIDLVLLVIAADEGIMPQTVEHLDILRLLDVRNGVVALTKIDTVEREWTDAVEEDVRSQLSRTSLANAPVVRVSAKTGKGIDALRKALLSAVSRTDPKNASLPFRLPVDRVFTRTGFGTVVTGTLAAGTIRVGDAFEVMPPRLTSRVRGLQVYGSKVESAEAGSRVAVNVVGIETNDIERGMQIAPPGSLRPTLICDVLLKMLPGDFANLQDRQRVRLHTGTAEILGRMRILDERTRLKPDEHAYIQFRAEEEFVCARGDRFVVRSYSPMQTIGGGIILETAPQTHKKSDPAMLDDLAAKERGRPEDILESLLLNAPSGLAFMEAAKSLQVQAAQLEGILELLVASRIAKKIAGDRLFHATVLSTLTDRLISTLQSFHHQYPLRAGLQKEELRGRLGNTPGNTMEARAFAALISHWERSGIVRSENGNIWLTDFKIELNDRQNRLLERIEQVYIDCRIAVPTIEEVAEEVKAPPDAVTSLLRVGTERGRFMRIKDGLYYHHKTYLDLNAQIRSYISRHGGLTVGAFRDLMQTNRTYALTALEYFDSIRVTRRVGDTRELIETGTESAVTVEADTDEITAKMQSISNG